MMKRLCALALVLLCALTLTGCSKEAAVDAYEQVVQLLGGLALTEDSRLQGARTPGEDGFAGSYQADYEDFSGKEVIFGGTTLGRRAGQSIRIRCTLDIGEGEARLMLRTGVDPARFLLREVLYRHDHRNSLQQCIKLLSVTMPTTPDYLSFPIISFNSSVKRKLCPRSWLCPCS